MEGTSLRLAETLRQLEGFFDAKLMSLRNRGSPSKRLFQEIELGEVL